MAQITPAQLRANFPEFANQSRYPTGLIQFWLTWAYSMLNASRFSTMLDSYAQLFAAHNIAIERRAMDEAQVANNAQSGTVGLTTGPMSAKSVDKVSVSYDTAASLDPDAGHWNLTIYGTRMWEGIKMFGAGPVQIGAGPFFLYYAGMPVWWGGWWDVEV
ncbi:MAG TPA: DUF4054 domain-containing protein [Rhizomicrobium sp.]